ncbi:MAG: glycosyltransferase [Candidatus Omnitrophica bacterium]|nr:glycosyltransferase [Candidatus Omnitrophota bacterium]
MRDGRSPTHQRRGKGLELKVLHVTNMYPTREKPYYGIFVKRQVDSLLRRGMDCRVRFIGRGLAQNLKSVIRLGEDVEWSDIVHCHFGHTGSLVLPWKIVKKRPLVVSFCGGDLLGNVGKNGRYMAKESVLALVNSLASRFFDYSLVQSAQLMERVRSRNKKIARYGTDTDQFREINREESKKAVGLGGYEGKIIFFMGQKDVPVKNYPLFREAMGRLRTEHKCLCLGNISSGNMVEMMNAADVCVLTSFHEGSPNVIREAMACNRPIVSVDVGDTREMLEPVEGCFVTSHDPGQIASAVSKALEHPKTEARERLIEMGLDTEGAASNIMAVYNDILSGSV